MSVLAFGEVLWDVYPDQNTLGGAPFNFSAHLSRLGTKTYLVSAVGEDELGQRTRECLREFQVEDAFTATVKEPTGVCRVTISPEGSPSYELSRDTAYDFIRLDEQQFEAIAASRYRALYFGTLAQRGEVSRRTLRRMLDAGRYEQVLFDVNIRCPFYSREILEHGLYTCSILKCSREEAGVFSKLGFVDTVHDVSGGQRYLESLCRELSRKYGINTILMTMDKDGAVVYDAASDQVFASGRPEGRVVSAVGAGDSFSACYLHFSLLGQPPEECLRKAVVLSDYVVGHMASVPEYTPELRKKLR